MDIRFKGKNPPTVKFTKTDQSAADLVIFNLAEYGKHMAEPEIDVLSENLRKACVEIGMLESEDAPKEGEK